MIQRVAIDTKRYQLLGESGFRAPNLRIDYASPVFQTMVRESFGDLLPWIRMDAEGNPYYENFDEESRETCGLSQAIEHASQIPTSELMRLQDGWIRLNEMASKPGIDASLRSMLLTLQLPDPNTERRRYRLYEDSTGAIRLHVFWGFVSREGRRPSVAATTAVVELMEAVGYQDRPGTGPVVQMAEHAETPPVEEEIVAPVTLVERTLMTIGAPKDEPRWHFLLVGGAMAAAVFGMLVISHEITGRDWHVNLAESSNRLIGGLLHHDANAPKLPPLPAKPN